MRALSVTSWNRLSAQIECNAPLNAIVARVVKEPSWADVTLDSSFMSADGASPQKMDMTTPPRIFAPIPRGKFPLPRKLVRDTSAFILPLTQYGASSRALQSSLPTPCARRSWSSPPFLFSPPTHPTHLNSNKNTSPASMT